MCLKKIIFLAVLFFSFKQNAFGLENEQMDPRALVQAADIIVVGKIKEIRKDEHTFKITEGSNSKSAMCLTITYIMVDPEKVLKGQLGKRVKNFDFTYTVKNPDPNNQDVCEDIALQSYPVAKTLKKGGRIIVTAKTSGDKWWDITATFDLGELKNIRDWIR